LDYREFGTLWAMASICPFRQVTLVALWGLSRIWGEAGHFHLILH
jgi:hypothetical protein